MNTSFPVSKLTVFLAFGLLINCSDVSAKTWYVKTGSQGNGSSWSNAFHNLQQALQYAQPGDAIWVAKGIYFPTEGEARNQSFQVKRSVELLGGFIGTETEANQRDPQRNNTTLSGNIGSFDAEDNTYHVLTIQEVSGKVIIDGFTIEDGSATGDAQGQRYGGGIYIAQKQELASKIELVGLSFRNNLAKDGGALYVETASKSCSLTVRNCRFNENEALLDGGAVCFKAGKKGTLQVNLQNCTLTSNRGNYGGAIFNHSYSGNVLLDMEACQFADNHAYAHGPEVYWLRPALQP